MQTKLFYTFTKEMFNHLKQEPMKKANQNERLDIYVSPATKKQLLKILGNNSVKSGSERVILAGIKALKK